MTAENVFKMTTEQHKIPRKFYFLKLKSHDYMSAVFIKYKYYQSSFDKIWKTAYVCILISDIK